MNRLISIFFGLVAYAFGLGSLVLFKLYVGGWDVLPWHIDDQPSETIGRALLINLGLIALFGIQHSVMARPGFKRAWTRTIPKSLERSCYCFATGAVVSLLCYCWQPLGGTVWHVDNYALSTALTTLQLLGWTIAVASSFMINHFELFGLQQVYYRFIEKPLPKPDFTVNYLYRFVRHPLQMGILIGIWATPHMSATHMFLAATMTAYITIGLYFEERDLVASLGQDYEQYRRQVPMVVPKLRGLSAHFHSSDLLSSDSASS